jgi:hypothetical protein
MEELTVNGRPPSFGREHIVAASVAAVASLILHIGMGYLAMQVNLQLIARNAQDRPPRKYEAVQLGSVEVTPQVQEQVLTALRDVASEAAPQVAEAVDEMAVAPEEVVTEPPPPQEQEVANISEPTPTPMRAAWTPPHQAIVVIEDRAVGDVMPGLERRLVPKVERVENAPDVILPGSQTRVAATGGPRGVPVAAPGVAEVGEKIIGGMDAARVVIPEAVDETVAPGGAKELFEESPEEVTNVEPIERVLTARVETYTTMRDLKYGYFRLEVERAGQELLPVRPKDIILVQDCSASMSEQRLYFCREGLRRSLAHIGAADRFNIARFADRTETCFDGWVKKTPETLEKAEAYINSMMAEGYTDLFASMQDLLKLEQEPGRPVVAFVITDGLANKGLTDNTAIIGEFSRRNAGKISVFTMGTFQQANQYLIDLLSYCNKGYVDVISKGRWDIPAAAEGIMQGISRPVLADLRLQFAANSSCEVYPQQVSNLYLDRPLILYGRYRRGDSRLLFQAVGQAGETSCDLIFDLPLGDEASRSEDKGIRQRWAKQKIYHLIGEYARTRDQAALLELRRTARSYGEDIPYKKSLF